MIVIVSPDQAEITGAATGVGAGVGATAATGAETGPVAGAGAGAGETYHGVPVRRIPATADDTTTIDAIVGMVRGGALPRVPGPARDGNDTAIVVIAASHATARSVGVAYRIDRQGRSVLPDMVYDHAVTPCVIADRPVDDPYLPAHVHPLVARLAATLLAAVPPHRVVTMLYPPDDTAADSTVLAVALAAYRAARRVHRVTSPPWVTQCESWIDEASRVLRLTVSQRRSLTTSARGAMVRGGVLPHVPEAAIRHKSEGKQALADLVERLDAIGRPAV